jgi:ribosome-associated protein
METTNPMKEYMANDFSGALAICCQIVADKKCADPKVFDVRQRSSITDHILLVTCTSEAHLRAVGDELYQTFKHRFEQLCRVDYQPLSGWLVFDAFDVILHAFTESMRRCYDLDKLFASSNLLDWTGISSLTCVRKT